MRHSWIVALGHFLKLGIFNCFLLLRMFKSYHCWNGVVFRNLVTFHLLHWILFNCGLVFLFIRSRVCWRGLVTAATALAEHDSLLECPLLLVIFFLLCLLFFLFVDFVQEGRNTVFLHLFLSCLGDFLQWQLIIGFERGLCNWCLVFNIVAASRMLVKFGVHFVFHSLQCALIHGRLPAAAKVWYLLLFDM